MPDELSIVIPTHNPQERIFARVLTAVSALYDVDGARPECVIVDNNSTPPIDQMACVQEFLGTCANARIVREPLPGLTFARLAGIRATSGNVIVVFDDDNVPDPAYLQVVAQCLKEHPVVGVWGAGKIEVELLDPVPSWLRDRAKADHSQRAYRSVQYGFTPAGWLGFYPIGMGQALRRDIAESYQRAVESGDLGATDRKGRSLASAGDVQIVWHAMTKGFAAGVHPKLAITHLIPESRTSLRYLTRLAFGLGSSYEPARAQAYPQEYANARPYNPKASRLLARLWRVVWNSIVHRRVRFLPIDLAGAMGDICGSLSVAGHGSEHWLFRLAARLGLR